MPMITHIKSFAIASNPTMTTELNQPITVQQLRAIENRVQKAAR